MTTNHQPHTEPRQISLRALALELGVHHSSLSAAVRDGRLTRGVSVDARGRVVVTDAAAAAAGWRAIHFRVDVRSRELELDAERVERAARRLAATQPEAVELHDVALDRRITAAELFAERDALSLLVGALVRGALADRTPAALKAHVPERLREVAELHGAGDEEIAQAMRELECAICVAVDVEA